MGIYVFIGLIALVVHIFMCVQFGGIAAEKGYDSTTYTLLCVFFGVIGYCLVVALPDKEVRNSLESIESNLRKIVSQAPKAPANVPTVASTAPVQSNFNPSVASEALSTPTSTIAAEDGDIICPNCGTKQRSSRLVCWNCGQHFIKD